MLRNVQAVPSAYEKGYLYTKASRCVSLILIQTLFIIKMYYKLTNILNRFITDRVVVCFCLFITFNHAAAQNLVPNPSFEEMNDCPSISPVLGPPGGNISVRDWYTANGGSTDYFHKCANPTNRGTQNGVPVNFPGYQEARTGDGYVGGHIFLYQAPPKPYREYREYIQAQLTTPLIAGHEYFVRFWVARSNRYQEYIIDHFGAHFSTFQIFGGGGTTLAGLPVHVDNTPGNFLRDTGSWTPISGTFTAAGGEAYIVIGNFQYAQNQQYERGGGNDNSAYYYIDDVCVYDMTDITSVHDTFICNQEINLSYSGSERFPQHVWSTGDSVRTINITEPGTYWVRSYEDCGWVVDTFIVRHHAIPPFSLGRDTAICDGSGTEIHAPVLPGISWVWDDGRTDTVIPVTSSGRYGITLYNEYCRASDEISIQIRDFAQDLGPDRTVCHNAPEDILLQAHVPDGAQVRWSTGSSESSIIVQDSGTYWVRVSDFLCMEQDTMQVQTEQCACAVNIPSAFTPNGDGRNDVFRMFIEPDCPVDHYRMNIYNRWGNRVFSSSLYTEGWDGTHQGNPAEAGSYFYEVQFEHGNRKYKYYKKGDLTLIR